MGLEVRKLSPTAADPAGVVVAPPGLIGELAALVDAPDGS
jgi:hypothetical protein